MTVYYTILDVCVYVARPLFVLFLIRNFPGLKFMQFTYNIMPLLVECEAVGKHSNVLVLLICMLICKQRTAETARSCLLPPTLFRAQ